MTGTFHHSGHCCSLLRASHQLLQNLKIPCVVPIAAHLQQKRHKMRATGNRGFYFPDKKMGLEKQMKEEQPMTVLKQMSEGLEILKRGVPKLTQQWKDNFNFDRDFVMQQNDYEYFAKFDEKTVKTWSATADSDMSEGKSTAKFTVSPSGKGLFHGYLNTEPVKDGITKKTGYCNISAPPNMNAFEKPIPYELRGYTDLALRVRGDGRNYMVIIQMDHHFSMHWYDMYNYPLFTRGGPYWQFVKIPFSKFYLASSGRIQDQQHKLVPYKIRHIGITLADNIDGPFQLELDYIALLRDEGSKAEDFEYEMYRKDPYLV